MNLIEHIDITAMFVGKRGTALDDGTPSGMIKAACTGPQTVGSTGIEGDYQADTKVHGGAEKALHHFPAEHYAAIADHFPQLQGAPAVGTLGENLSSRDVTENSICIGDMFVSGTLRIQVTQPRKPCWKIDRRLGVKGVAAHIRLSGTTGWYYRVLEAGEIGAGDRLQLCERQSTAPTIAEFQQLTTENRPSLTRLAEFAELRFLPDALRKSLAQRLEWLKRNG